MKRFITKGCVLLAALTMSLMSCTDSQDEVKPVETVKPGVYATDITLYAEQGEDPDINTRGLNTGTGEFTAVYPYNYIYIHSADNEDSNHKSLKILLKEVEYCDECKGIHLEMEVLDNDGGYTITSSEGTIKLSNSESVYFSTISSPYWEAEVEGATPVSGSDVFVESDANSELLKSANTYTRDELINLIEQDVPVIEMTRHCTGFRVYFMFTHVPANGSTNNVIYDPNTRTDYWEETFPEEENIMPGNFYIKLYLGPNFCHKFDLLNGKAVVEDVGGYYATNGQNYQSLEYVNYSFTGGDNNSSYSYNGYGYVTADLHYLISPLNANIDASKFSIYAFVKYSPTANSTDESYLGSDVGSKYFQAVIPDITLTLNRIHYVIMAFDVEDLRKAFIDSSSSTDAKTRSPWEEPEKIELKPVKVICR